MSRPQLATAAGPAEAPARFSVVTRLRAARVTPALIRELDALLAARARAEADRVTRLWFAAQRRAGTPPSELADLTLAYYERARAQFRPTYELSYGAGREERASRYRNADALLRWAERQRDLRPSTFALTFAAPGCRVRLHLHAAPAYDRSYLWAEGDEPEPLDELTAALTAAIRRAAGRGTGWKRWPVNVAVAGLASLSCGVGLAFRLRPAPWPLVLLGSLVVDCGALFLLLLLFPRAWPAVSYHLPPATAAARRREWLARAVYVGAALALFALGGWSLLTTFYRFTW
jgi:hypothetical protein